MLDTTPHREDVRRTLAFARCVMEKARALLFVSYASDFGSVAISAISAYLVS